MDNRRNKNAGTVAAVLALGTVLAACSGGEDGNSASASPDASAAPTSAAQSASPKPDVFQIGSEPVSFTLFGNYGWYTQPRWGEDIFTKAIKEKYKIDIVPIQAGGNAEAKLNTMIASNDLPDVIWGERDGFNRLIENGQIVPLDPYLDKYPNLKKWAGDEVLNMLRHTDGKLYLFPNWYTNKPTGNAGYVVNKKIYEELGKPKLETTDDLYAYLKLVKEKYGDSIIPFEPGQASEGKGVDLLYSAFRENNPATFMGNLRAVPKDGKFTSIFADPVFKEALTFVNKLHREKLMTQDALTQKVDQVQEKLNQGRVAVYADITAIEYAGPADALLKQKDPNAGYFMIWPIHKPGLDKNKITVAHYDRLGWNAAAITKKAKDPEKIFAVLDWMTGEQGTREIIWGPEGMYWQGTDSEGLPLLLDTFVTDPDRQKNMSATDNLQFVGNAAFNDKIKLKAEQKLPPEKRSWATTYQDSITWKTHIDLTPMRGIEPPKDSEEGVIRERIIELYKKARAQAILAKSEQEVSDIIDKAEKDAQSLGYQKLLDYYTAKWKANEAKMAKK
ncbi:extracellular solute-binding protein [Paenibacillus thermoaerophilus]|uniref:Extracellular solute-binding protein n=1 Tax=Paenibacillus thermoaerophilus TaxID=1215385 RepID=A0ABW2V665_9BACL|nr:extracellular solute-binding protein [Paenibacillus thermoaerophilus]TMV16177.1 extracellular solute-binding protein [Paenibacillus thermoaerophilus]